MIEVGYIAGEHCGSLRCRWKIDVIQPLTNFRGHWERFLGNSSYFESGGACLMPLGGSVVHILFSYCGKVALRALVGLGHLTPEPAHAFFHAVCFYLHVKTVRFLVQDGEAR